MVWSWRDGLPITYEMRGGHSSGVKHTPDMQKVQGSGRARMTPPSKILESQCQHQVDKTALDEPVLPLSYKAVSYTGGPSLFESLEPVDDSPRVSNLT